MEWERFTCCQKEPKFKKIKGGYQCMGCGKIFLYRSIDYNGETKGFDKLKYQLKVKGSRSDYIKGAGIFSTLQNGMVNFIHMDDKYSVLDTKNIKVKKAAMEHRLNFNNTFLTISTKGIIDVYSTDMQEAVAQYKTERRKDGNYYNICIYPLEKGGKWIYVDREKISCCSNDFKECQTLLLFRDIIKGEVLTIRSVDHNPEYSCFAVHINHFTERINNNRYIRNASFMICCQDGQFDIRYIRYAPANELTYDFEKRIYRGACYDKMIVLNEQCGTDELCRLPTVRKYSDGGGNFWVEEFIRFPEKIYFLTEEVIALLYLQEIIILDLQKSKIIAAYETGYNLIATFFVMDANTICFSVGLNTYIVDIDYDKDNQ